MSRSKLKTLVLINWRGVFYQPFDMDKFITSLTGLNGAGKTTVMSGVYVSLLPDKTLLDLRNQAGKGVSSKKQGLYGKFGPGNVSYSIIELVTSTGERVLGGVQIRKKAAPEFELIPFLIQGVSPDVKIEDIFLIRDGKQDTIVDSSNNAGMIELAQIVKANNGSLRSFKGRVGEYMSSLYELGLMPMRLNKVGERKKFNKLLQTSLFGGLSGEIQQSLKDYLLDKDTTLSSQISRAESNLATCKQTREAIERTEKNRLLIENVYKSASEMASSVIADITSKYKASRDKVIEARAYLKENTLALGLLDTSKSSTLELIQENKDSLENLEEQIIVKTNELSSHEKAQKIISEIDEKIALVKEQTFAADTFTKEIEKLESELSDKASREVNLSDQVSLIVKQLVDANETFNIETKKASLYKAAVSAKEQFDNAFPNSEGDDNSILETRAGLETRRKEIADETYHLKNQLDDFQKARDLFSKSFKNLEKIKATAPELMKTDITRENAHQVNEQLVKSLRHIEEKLREFDYIRRDLHQVKIQIQNSKHVKDVSEPLGISTADDFSDKIEYLSDLTDTQKGQISSLEHEIFDVEDEIKEKELLLRQSQNNSKKSDKAQTLIKSIKDSLNIQITCEDDIDASQVLLKSKKDSILEEKYKYTHERNTLSSKVSDLQNLKTFDDDKLIEFAGEIGGDLMSDLLDNLDLKTAAYMEAKLGPLKHAISVENPSKVIKELKDSSSIPKEVYLVNRADLEENLKVTEFDGRLIVKDLHSIRISQIPSNPILGADARDKEIERVERRISKISENLINLELQYDRLNDVESCIVELRQYIEILFGSNFEGESSKLLSELDELSESLEELSEKLETIQEEYDQNKEELIKLQKIEHLSHLLDENDLESKATELESNLKTLSGYQSKYGKLISVIPTLAEGAQYLKYNSVNTPEEISSLIQLKEEEKKGLSTSISAINDYLDLKEYLRYEKSTARLNSDDSLNEELTKEKEELEVELKSLKAEISDLDKNLRGLISKKDTSSHLADTYQKEVSKLEVILDDLNLKSSEEIMEEVKAEIDTLREEKIVCQSALDDAKTKLGSITSDIQHLENKLAKGYIKYKEIRGTEWYIQKQNHQTIKNLISSNPIFSSLDSRIEELEKVSQRELSSIGGKSLAELKAALVAHASGSSVMIKELLETLNSLLSAPFGSMPEDCIKLFSQIHSFMEQQLPRDIVDSDNPLEALAKLSTHIQKLRLKLKHHENDFSTSSNDVAYGIEQKIRKEFRNIARLNEGLDKVRFGNIRAIQIKFHKKPGMDSILQALLEKGNESPLFGKEGNISFEEALQSLYETHIGKKFTGESLLDFRHYIELQVQIRRKGNEAWENADSNRLSTGESIGVGLSILIMVLQSWETNTMRITGKRHDSLRFLFLDEASRLDISSINTLASLCANMGLQLLIAAPSADEAITGTTYCLNRVVDVKGKERVVVRGLRGFKKESRIEFGDNAYQIKKSDEVPKQLTLDLKSDSNLQPSV